MKDIEVVIGDTISQEELEAFASFPDSPSVIDAILSSTSDSSTSELLKKTKIPSNLRITFDPKHDKDYATRETSINKKRRMEQIKYELRLRRNQRIMEAQKLAAKLAQMQTQDPKSGESRCKLLAEDSQSMGCLSMMGDYIHGARHTSTRYIPCLHTSSSSSPEEERPPNRCILF